jgi:hypothetical protein
MVAPIVGLGIAALFLWGCDNSDDDRPENNEVRGKPYEAPKVYNPTPPKKARDLKCITSPALSNPLLNPEPINGLCIMPTQDQDGKSLQQLTRFSSTAPQVPVLLADLENIGISSNAEDDLGHFVEIDTGVFATPYYNVTWDELDDTIGILVFDANNDTFKLTPIEAIDVSGRHFFDQEGLELVRILPKAQVMGKNRWTYNQHTRSMYIGAANFETEEVWESDWMFPKKVNTEEAALVVKVDFDEENVPHFDDVAVMEVGVTSKEVFQIGKDGKYIIALTGDLATHRETELYSDGSERVTYLTKPGTGLYFNIFDADTLNPFDNRFVEGMNALYLRGGIRVFVSSNDGSKLVAVGGGEENPDGFYCVHTLDPLSERMFLGSKCLFIPTSEDFKTAYAGNIPEGAVNGRMHAADAAFTDDGKLYVLDGDFGAIVGLKEDDHGAYTEVDSVDIVIDPTCGDSVEDGTYFSNFCNVFEVLRSFSLDFPPEQEPFYIRKAQNIVTLGNTIYVGTPGGLYKIEK